MKINGRQILIALLAVTFVWPGLHKFYDPGYWVMWLPQFLGPTPESGTLMVYGLAVIEIGIGVGLLVRRTQRWAALAGSVYLTLILVVTGVTPVTFRDLGLLGGTTYLALEGAKLEVPWLQAKDARKSPEAPRPTAEGRKPVFLFLVAAVVVGGLAFGSLTYPQGSSSSCPSGPMGEFVSPHDGGELPAGNVEVKVRFLIDPGRCAVSHVHFRLDGKVADVIYITSSTEEVATTLRSVPPGDHTLRISFAFMDHVELERLGGGVQFIAR